MKATEIPLEVAASLCRRLVPLADRLNEYTLRLEVKGFSAFAPMRDFYRSFCEGDEERASYDRYVVEKARNTIGRPWPYLATREEQATFYSSAFIEAQLLELRSIDGVHIRDVLKRYPKEIWRIESNICARRRVEASFRDRDRYERERHAAISRQQQMLHEEVSRHEIVSSPAETLEDRLPFFVEVMQRELGSLGFEYDRGKSLPEFPVFSKAIGKCWHLCWALEDVGQFMLSPVKGRLVPALQLRHYRKRGPSGEQARQFLVFRFQQMFPGFLDAYSFFFDMLELQLIIRSHLTLYGFMSNMLEAAIAETLSEAGL